MILVLSEHESHDDSGAADTLIMNIGLWQPGDYETTQQSCVVARLES